MLYRRVYVKPVALLAELVQLKAVPPEKILNSCFATTILTPFPMSQCSIFKSGCERGREGYNGYKLSLRMDGREYCVRLRQSVSESGHRSTLILRPQATKLSNITIICEQKFN